MAIKNAEDLATEWLDKFPLSTQGRHVVDRHGKRFKLAGVNWYGASDAYHVVGGLDVQSLPQICAAVRELGFSVVRLPFSNEMLRAREPTAGSINFDLNPSLKGLTPLQVLDEVVRELGRCRVAVILNNHTTFSTWCGGPDENGLWFLHDREAHWGPQTEAQWIEDWVMLASRYAACPHVVGYDLRNEVRMAPGRVGPRGAVPWLRYPIVGSSAADPEDARAEESCAPRFFADWAKAASMCAERLRRVNADPLLIVERIVWPQRGLAPYARQPGPLLPRFAGKLVLAVHSYCWSAPGRYIVQWSLPSRLRPIVKLGAKLGIVSWRNHGDMAAEGAAELRELMHKEWGWVLEQNICPVWVSEFGASRHELQWFDSFVAILKDYDADWAYWPLNVGPKPASGGDEPYGMLTSSWTPPPKGSDARLKLLEGIMSPSGGFLGVAATT